MFSVWQRRSILHVFDVPSSGCVPALLCITQAWHRWVGVSAKRQFTPRSWCESRRLWYSPRLDGDVEAAEHWLWHCPAYIKARGKHFGAFLINYTKQFGAFLQISYEVHLTLHLWLNSSTVSMHNRTICGLGDGISSIHPTYSILSIGCCQIRCYTHLHQFLCLRINLLSTLQS